MKFELEDTEQKMKFELENTEKIVKQKIFGMQSVLEICINRKTKTQCVKN